MPLVLEGQLLAAQVRVAVVVSQFNEFITSRLLSAAVNVYVKHGGNADEPGMLVMVKVPGSFELAGAALRCAQTGRFDAVVCLGCLIRGQTQHFDFIAQQAAAGIARVSLETPVAASFGVVTADTVEQAIDRAGGKEGNLGARAMVTAIETAHLFRKLRDPTTWEDPQGWRSGLG